MPESQVDLATLFNKVTEALQGEKDSLNEADSYNHDHGDHMVENFKAITEALEQKRGAPPAEQLAYASERLNQSFSSDSAKLYSQGLTRAANQLQGQPTITNENAVSLVQSLLGGEENEPPSMPATRSKPGSGTNLNTLLTAGTAYMQAQKEGASPLEALIKAVMSGSQMNQSSHQSQSGQVVGGTLISALSAMLGGAKPQPKPRPKPASRPKAKPKTKPKPKPATHPKPKTKPKSVSKSKPKPKRRTE